MFPIKQVYLEPSLETHPSVQRILQGLGHLPRAHIGNLNSLIDELVSCQQDPWKEGKQIILIRSYQGRLVKDCPGTRDHICCGYKIINVMSNCPMDCSYCILQGYLNNPFLTLYPEFEKVFREIEDILERHPHRFFRFGTGELGDSLALDGIVGFSSEAVPFFASKKNGILELKTKASGVDHLLTLDHKGRTVVSWSLNPSRIIEEDEHMAAQLGERLRAARLCQDVGYPLGFHFDPLIHYPGWEEGYRKTVDLLFEYIDPRRVIWISFGGLRCSPSLKHVAQGRFPHTRIFSGELIPGKDGKLRYVKPIRVEMYQKMVSWLQAYDKDLFIYLCMERDDVWQEVFGWSPKTTGGLNKRFEERIAHFVMEGK